ncbi:MAG: anti-sigma factor antagonist [Streptosporangiaceae bacterium]
MELPPWEVTSRSHGGVMVISAVGELDISTAHRLRAYLAALTMPLYGPLVVLDLAGVPFCDSSGLGALVGTWKDLRERQGVLALAAPQQQVARILHTTGLDTRLPVHPSVPDALKGLAAEKDEQDPDAVEQVLRELKTHEGGSDLELLCRACVKVLGGDGVSLAVISGQYIRETLCASDPEALHLDQLQFTIGEGPSLEAHETGRPVLSADLHSTPSRWPLFTAAVGETAPRLKGIYGFPVVAGPHHIGAMDIYSDTTRELTEQQIEQIERACRIAAPMILEQLPEEILHNLRGSLLQYGIVDRSEVYHAAGILMSEMHIDIAEAFARLRGYAFAHGMLIEDAAADVTSRRVSIAR